VSETTVSRSRQNTRARLFEAALQVFAEQGIAGASVEAICERAGFTRGAFYSNFETKEELFLELIWQICEAKLADVSERVSAIPERGDEPVELGDLVRSLVSVAIESPDVAVLMSELRTNALRDDRMAAAYLAWQDRMAERVALLIEDIARRTGLRLRMEPVEFARIILIIWDGTESQALMRKLSHDALAALIADRTASLAGALVDDPPVG